MTELPRRRIRARYGPMSSCGLALTLGLTALSPGGVARAVGAVPAQNCVTPPCVPDTTVTTVTTLPNATTSTTGGGGGGGRPGTETTTTSGGGGGGGGASGTGVLGSTSSSSSGGGGLPVTGGDVLGLVAIGVVLVGFGAVAVAVGRRGRARRYG